MAEINTAKTKRRRLALAAGLFLLTVYLLVYRGGFHSIDEVSIFAVSESLVKFGRLNTDQIAWTQWTTSQAEAQGFFGADGHVYSKKGLALSLAQAPLYWLGFVLPGLGMLQTVSLLNGLITAATGLIILMFGWRLGYSTGTALFIALIYGLATIAFVYAKYLFSEPLAGFSLLLAAYMVFTYRQEGGQRHLAVAGLAAGLAVLTRANNLFLLPILGLYLLWIIIKTNRDSNHHPQEKNSPFAILALWVRHALRPLLIFLVTAAIPGLVLLAYNTVRSGNPFQTGYDLTLFSPNILLGLYKLLFSPLRGLFIYSPILLVSLPGWWLFRKAHTAEAWLFAGLVGVTVALFSAWSSGEGLSWGSRFLVPVVPFLVILLAPLIDPITRSPHSAPRSPLPALRLTFYALLVLSIAIQLLGVTINPWVFLAQVQVDFGGEFFLENTAALYNFGYSQIAGQLQSWSIQNSDLAWWQPWGFDGLAFGLSLGLVLVAGWLLWREAAGGRRSREAGEISPLRPCSAAPLPLFALLTLTAVVTYLLLARYYITDRQFGPPGDSYTQALEHAASQAAPGDQLVTVAQYHYHVPMNRFKTRLPLIGLAQQSWPPPATALPLLEIAQSGRNSWLVTHGLAPAAPDNAAEQWLALNAYKASDEWLGDVRLVRYGNTPPTGRRRLDTRFGSEIELVEIKTNELVKAGQILPVEFVWQPLRQPQGNYNIFLQLLDAAGRPVAQHDGPPNGGYTPTSTWLPDQSLSDRHGLAAPVELPAATYRLIAGLYDPATGARLTTPESGDFVELGKIKVER